MFRKIYHDMRLSNLNRLKLFFISLNLLIKETIIAQQGIALRVYSTDRNCFSPLQASHIEYTSMQRIQEKTERAASFVHLQRSPLISSLT